MGSGRPWGGGEVYERRRGYEGTRECGLGASAAASPTADPASAAVGRGGRGSGSLEQGDDKNGCFMVDYVENRASGAGERASTKCGKGAQR